MSKFCYNTTDFSLTNNKTTTDFCFYHCCCNRDVTLALSFLPAAASAPCVNMCGCVCTGMHTAVHVYKVCMCIRLRDILQFDEFTF